MVPKKIQEWSRLYGLESGPGVQAKKKNQTPDAMRRQEIRPCVCKQLYGNAQARSHGPNRMDGEMQKTPWVLKVATSDDQCVRKNTNPG